jgi:hypothetical protein
MTDLEKNWFRFGRNWFSSQIFASFTKSLPDLKAKLAG